MTQILFTTEDGVKVYSPKRKVYMVEKGSYDHHYRPFEAQVASKCGWAFKFSRKKAATIFALTKKIERHKKSVGLMEKELEKIYGNDTRSTR